MGNCVDKGDGNAGADGKGLKGIAGLVGKASEYSAKNDAGRVALKILEDGKFELSDFEGEGEEAKNSWKGEIKEVDGAWTFDASGDGGTESEVKSFKPTLEESGNLKFDHKFTGDIEELSPVGEAEKKEEAPAE